MPGIFGCIGADEDVAFCLQRGFERIWPDAVHIGDLSGMLGGHAFGSAGAVRVHSSGTVGAVDGETSLYERFQIGLPKECDDVRQLTSADLRRLHTGVGNVALMSRDRRSLVLVNDWSGTFPIYYAQGGRGLLFSSLLAPLASATGAEPDDLAIVEYLRAAYTTENKTLFRGVHRLLPGQILRFSIDDGLTREEASPLWIDVKQIGEKEAAEAAWHHLGTALGTGGRSASSTALMMSGGWDSRTLLAGLLDLPEQSLVAYSHGDTSSRELGIVKRLCAQLGVPVHLEAIDERVLDLEFRAFSFSRTENISFPYWHLAGKLLEGKDRIVAGVYGEVLGGHYGPAMLARGLGRVTSVALPLLTGRSGLKRYDRDATNVAAEYLRVAVSGRHWYLRDEFEDSFDNLENSINGGIESALRRLRNRGIDDPVRLIEAFITEHRGTQFIAAQLLSCRAHTDVSFPFAHPEFLRFASELPFQIKVHNVLNRRMLLDRSPRLLDEPMAATLLPARAPIAAQEASRAVRKVLERRKQRGAAGHGSARLGWVDFDFLRRAPELDPLVDSLQSPIWDRPAIRRRVLSLAAAPREALHPFFDQISKVMTVDMMLSAVRTARVTARR